MLLILMDDCNIFAWNITGLNSPLKKSELKKIILSQHVTLGTVLETRIRKDSWSNFDRYWKTSCNLDMVSNIDHDKNCRIAVFWDSSKVKVVVLSMNAHVIHCSVKSVDGRSSFHCSFVYAYNSLELRKELWEDLLLFSQTTEPWTVLGDFNVVLNSSEKLHDLSSPCNVSSKLSDFLQQTDLHDHKYLSQKFT